MPATFKKPPVYKLAFIIATFFNVLTAHAQPLQIDSLQKLLPSAKNDTTKARLYFNIASAWSRMNPDSAGFYVKKAAELFLQEKYTRGNGDAALLQARIKVNINEAFTALHHYKKALEYYTQLEDTNGQAATYSGMGVAYGMQEKFPLALTHIIQSLKIYERNKNLKGIANAYMKIGVVYNKTNNLDAALPNYLKALAIAVKSKDVYNQAAIHGNIGSLYGQMHKLDKALVHLKQSKWLGTQAHINPIVADANMNIGNAYKELKQYDSAKHYYSLAGGGFKVLQNNENLSRNYTSLAGLYFEQKQYPGAKLAIKQSMDIALAISNHALLYDNYELLVMISKAENDFKAASKYYSELLSLKDTVFNERRDDQLQRIKAEFQQEKDEQLIDQLQVENERKTKQRNILMIAIVVTGALLFLLLVSLWMSYQRNLQLKKRKQELQEMNLMKDKFLSVISHDLRSPLANILQLLHMIRDDDNNREQKMIFDRLKLTTSSVLETMDNMLAWGKNYFVKGIVDKQQIDLGVLAKRVCRFLKENADNKEIEIENKIGEGILLAADENQLEFILRNLISNAVKFSHEKSSIVLSAKALDHAVNIHVKDYGKGMRVDQQLKLFDITKRESTKGTAGETGSGLGLFLSNEFITLHGGTLDVQSEQDKGTEFIVTLPTN